MHENAEVELIVCGDLLAPHYCYLRKHERVVISLNLAVTCCHQYVFWLNAETSSCDVDADVGDVCESAEADLRLQCTSCPFTDPSSE